MTQIDINREWAKMLLANWNRAVELWDDGQLFGNINVPNYVHWSENTQRLLQREYARICVSWLIPNNFNEPHMTAEGY